MQAWLNVHQNLKRIFFSTIHTEYYNSCASYNISFNSRTFFRDKIRKRFTFKRNSLHSIDYLRSNFSHLSKTKDHEEITVVCLTTKEEKKKKRELKVP